MTAATIGIIWLLAVGGVEQRADSCITEIPRQLAIASTAEAAKESGDLAVEQHRRLIGDLVRVLRTSDRSAVKAQACRLLGVYGGASGASEVVENLMLRAPVEPGRIEVSPFGVFPCQEALLSFGSRSSWPLLYHIKEAADSAERATATRLLLQIVGAEGTVAELERRLREPAPEAERQRYEEALAQARKERH